MICIDLSDHYHKQTHYWCDYCDFKSLEEEGIDEHLQTEHLDMIEEHIMRSKLV